MNFIQLVITFAVNALPVLGEVNCEKFNWPMHKYVHRMNIYMECIMAFVQFILMTKMMMMMTMMTMMIKVIMTTTTMIMMMMTMMMMIFIRRFSGKCYLYHRKMLPLEMENATFVENATKIWENATYFGKMLPNLCTPSFGSIWLFSTQVCKAVVFRCWERRNSNMTSLRILNM